MARIMVATNAVADAPRSPRRSVTSGRVGVCRPRSRFTSSAAMTSRRSHRRCSRQSRARPKWLLHTMIALAVERSGVDPVNVTIHVRDGNVPDALIEFASNTRPDSVLIGAPRGSAHNVFTPESFTELLGRFEQAGISVEQVETS